MLIQINRYGYIDDEGLRCMVVLLHSTAARLESWRDALLEAAPELDVRLWPNLGDPEEIEVLIAWLPPEGLIARLPNLKLLQCFGAGVDQLSDVPLPDHLFVARLVNADQTRGMVEYVLASVLRYHRHFDRYANQQAARVWQRLPHINARDRKVGIMGLGELGIASAGALGALDFNVSGWSRSQKDRPGLRQFAGPEALPEFLRDLDILVCLLPLTSATEGLLDRRIFEMLPRGARLINASRGALVNERDLLAALEHGQLAAATLDVAQQEPPPETSPLWDHPAITLTPHIATIATPLGTIPGLVANIRLLQDGRTPRHLIDRTLGY